MHTKGWLLMKVIEVETSTGFKMLEPGFKISFLSQARVNPNMPNNDLMDFGHGFYYPIETVLIGKNSSGKTTSLEFLSIIFELLDFGRIKNTHFDDSSEFSIRVVFYSAGLLFRYIGTFKKDNTKSDSFMVIQSESLERSSFKNSYRKDLSNASYFKISEFKPHIDFDTSSVRRYAQSFGGNFYLISSEDHTEDFSTFYSFLTEPIFESLVRLFDDSVEYIKPATGNESIKNGYRFKRVGSSKESTVDSETLIKLLSKGTIKGINLYSLAIITFIQGGHLLVDEIESSFNKNLVENLFLMFNDRTINKSGGTIIYTTHYSELLNFCERCDNINVLHRNGSSISIKNLREDYYVRSDVLKGTQFDNNTFDTLINYDRLMDLKKAIRNRK